jgi:hypothetical protein
MTDSNVREDANTNEPGKVIPAGTYTCPGSGCGIELTYGIERCPNCDQAVFWQPKFKAYFTWKLKRYSYASTTTTTLVVLSDTKELFLVRDEQESSPSMGGINIFRRGKKYAYLCTLSDLNPDATLELIAEQIGVAIATPVIMTDEK